MSTDIRYVVVATLGATVAAVAAVVVAITLDAPTVHPGEDLRSTMAPPAVLAHFARSVANPIMTTWRTSVLSSLQSVISGRRSRQAGGNCHQWILRRPKLVRRHRSYWPHHQRPRALHHQGLLHWIGGDHVQDANGSGLSISYIGHSSITGLVRPLRFNHILHAPKINKHLISVRKLAYDNDAFVEFHRNCLCQGLSHGDSTSQRHV